MAKIKNVSGEARTVPALGGRLVLPDAVVEVPDNEAKSFTCQETNWELVKAPAAKKAPVKSTTKKEG